MLRRNRLSVVLIAAWTLVQIFGSYGNSQPEYSSYQIDATFNPDDQTINGRQTIHYINDSEEPLAALFFLLMPNYDREINPYLDESLIDGGYPDGFDPSWLKIDGAQDALGNSLSFELLEGPASFQTYSLNDTLLKVRLPAPLAPGEQTDIVLEFATRFPETSRGDEAQYRDVYIWRFGWNPVAIPARELIQGEYISTERPYYKMALPAAYYTLNLTLPATYEAAIGADEQSVASHDSETKTIHAVSSVPVRSVPIGISEHFKIYQRPHDGRSNGSEPELLVYYLPGHEDSARILESYAWESLTAYQPRWGEYPHRRLLIIETPSTEAGFSGAAADAFILINQVYFTERDLGIAGFLNRLVDYLLAHEIAHQWWGIGVGVDTNAENFLSESFAQYLSITYFEEKYGEFGPNVFQLDRDGILEKIVDHQFGYINLREHLQGELPYLNAFINRFDEAVVKPQQGVKFFNTSGERIYNKGYLMLRALSGIIGKESMDQFIKTAAKRFIHRTAGVRDLQAVAEEVSGQELSEFFQLALYEDADDAGQAPFVDYSITDVTSERKQDGTFESKVHLSRLGKIRMPVQVVATAHNDEVQSQSWKLEDQTERDYVMTFKTQDPLSEVGLDPNSMTPDVNRLNNYYVLDGLSLFNRKLTLNTTGRNEVPLDSYMVKVNPFYQYLEGGYLFDHSWILGNGLLGFAKYFGRGNSFSLLGVMTPIGLLGEVNLTQTFFAHPTTGYIGTFWEPTNQVKISFSRTTDLSGSPFYDRRSDATGRVFNVLGLTWAHQESIRRRFASWLRVLDDPESFIRFDGGLWSAIRLAPGITLDGLISAGWSDTATGIFQFNLANMQTYAGVPGYPFVGRLYFTGRINLNLPFQREMGYNLLNAAVLQQIDERIYFEFGNVWADSAKIDSGVLQGMLSQAGFEVTLSGRTFGGLFPWSVRIGIAYPLGNIPEDQRILRQYFDISTPFF